MLRPMHRLLLPFRDSVARASILRRGILVLGITDIQWWAPAP